MEIKKNIVPYEFLARFGDSGELKGAHVGFMTVISEGDAILSRNVDNVQPVAMGEALGFPLAEILDIIQIEALKSVEQKTAELSQANLKITVLNSEKSALIAEKTTLASENERLLFENTSLREALADLQAQQKNAGDEKETPVKE